MLIRGYSIRNTLYAIRYTRYCGEPPVLPVLPVLPALPALSAVEGSAVEGHVVSHSVARSWGQQAKSNINNQ